MFFSAGEITIELSENELKEGLELFSRGRVGLLSKSQKLIELKVDDCSRVRLDINEGLTSDTKASKYLVAALKYMETIPEFARLSQALAKKRADSLLELNFKEEIEFQELKLNIEIALLDEGLLLQLKIGDRKLYAVKSLSKFFENAQSNEDIIFGKYFTFNKERHSFTKSDSKVLDFLKTGLKTGETREINSRIFIENSKVSAFLELLRTKDFYIAKIGGQKGIAKSNLPFSVRVKGDENQIRLDAALTKELRLIGDDGRFILSESKVYELDYQDGQIAKLLIGQSLGRVSSLIFTRDKFSVLLSKILPYLERRISINYDGALSRKLVREKLVTKLYVDKQGKNIAVSLKFCYGKRELMPFKNIDNELILRDSNGEKALLDCLYEMGFRLNNDELILRDEALIYEFVKGKAAELRRFAEVFVSREFEKIKLKKAKLSGNVSLSNGGLLLDIFSDNEKIDDVKEILSAINERKKYFRLKDDSFIELDETENFHELSAVLLENEKNGKLPPFMASEINSLVREKALNISFSKEAMDLAALRAGEIKTPDFEIHSYQKRGLEWLFALNFFGLGGILADEMGLGKTVQLLSCLLEIRRRDVENNVFTRPSLVLVPSSLVYHWQMEVNKFAGSLPTILIVGSKEERLNKIAQVDELNGGIVICSYPSLRQDFEELSKIEFNFCVLDEAQAIKNPYGQTARAAKLLKAKSKICLTGTPLENNIADLWSIFDFCLPGFLPQLNTYLARYQKEGALEGLNKKISPFIMRRLKKDVISELPPKIESTYLAYMPKEQEMIYRAHKLRLKDRLENALEREQATKLRGEILSWLTELRQVCCSPRLVNESYIHKSAKELLLMDILPSIIDNGHRVLIFSQFTRMLRILLNSIESMGISCFYLDGKTKIEDRLSLVERFNKGENSVFLISLKAGGTGLNLSGADTVINFDPWWNPQSENQAIDRAHRLGQEKTVQVIRLVTKDTIEEKVMQLSQNKREIFDALIGRGENINSTSIEEMIKLLTD